MDGFCGFLDHIGLDHAVPRSGANPSGFVSLAAFREQERLGVKSQVNVWTYDYIQLGKELLEHNFKEGFEVMRQFFLSHSGEKKFRGGKPCSWSIDFTVIDLPTGL